ncbi:GGDEF domain-containing protein [Photobacterium angustum]|uniref:diguanylate cyclase n=1 Tax=Photobacterium angustum (strain S14 / CCUG 15956) TaxID=314292 RepID=Q1ZPU6_PHOAS|nr:GGDEF domain-containing protein [Photobacterium angustum]EAS64551.1 hypothetical protein VAS14_02496 [Photobacterium angustum S14]
MSNKNSILIESELYEVKIIKKKIILALSLYYVSVLILSGIWYISVTEGPALFGINLFNFLEVIQFIFVFVMLYVFRLARLMKLNMASYILLTVSISVMFILLLATEGANFSYMFLIVTGVTIFALLRNKQAILLYLTASALTFYLACFVHDYPYEALFNLFVCIVLSTSLCSVVNYSNSVAIRKLILYSSVDMLTGLLNRSSLNNVINSNNHTLKALALLDIDHFKSINDAYGHDAGDGAIKAFASCLKENIRDTDVAFRWGGDEFLVLIRGQVNDNIDAYCVFDRLRTTVEAMDIDGVPKFTVSIGYCSYDSNVDIKTLIKQADLALYDSKKTGRNRVAEYKSRISDEQIAA